MKGVLKRIGAAVLAVCIVLSFPFITFAEEDELEGKTVILHSNDVHGAIGGYRYIAGLKKELEQNGAEVILVDAGDYSQGSMYVNTAKGADAITVMNAAGYDVACVGNHEFDYGVEQLLDNAEKADFSIVCANVLDEQGNLLFAPNAVYETGSGLKIGFFGLDTPEAMTKVNPALVKGLKFAAGEELYTLARQQVEELSDADLVVCLSHLGVDNASAPSRSYDLYSNVSGLDFVIDGHSHTVMEQGENGEKIQSAGTEMNHIGVIVIDNASKTIEDNYLIAVDENTPSDPAAANAAQEIIDRIDALYGQVFAVSEVELNGERFPGNQNTETNLGDLIADAMQWAALKNRESIPVDADHIVTVQNGGSVRAWLHIGEITKKDINTVLPFSNTLMVVNVTGEELLEALEASTYCAPDGKLGGFPQISGMKIEIAAYNSYDAESEPYPSSTYYGPASIRRVTVKEVNGKPFKKDDVYAVVTNSFCAAGGDTYYVFSNASSQFDTGLFPDEIVMQYITEELDGVIGNEYEKPQNRITVVTEKPVTEPEESSGTEENPDTGCSSAVNFLPLAVLLLAGLAVKSRKSV